MPKFFNDVSMWTSYQTTRTNVGTNTKAVFSCVCAYGLLKKDSALSHLSFTFILSVCFLCGGVGEWGRVVADRISRVKQNIITFYNLIVLFYFLCFQVNISKKQQTIKTCKKILCLSSSVFIPKRRGSDGRVIKINYGLKRSRDLAFPTKFGHLQMILRKCSHEERQLSELMPLTSA